MTGGPVLVLAQGPDRLRPALSAVPNRQVIFVEDLAEVPAALETHQPEIMLSFHDTGFDGPEFGLATRFPSVKWVHVSGSGFEHLGELPGDVVVTNAQGLRARNLAETALGAMIMLNQGLLRYRNQQQARRWQVNPFRPLEGQRLLIVGAGAIGQWLAQFAQALGMYVTGLNRDGRAVEGFDETAPLSQLEEYLPGADVVSLHLRATAETEGLFDAGKFALMRPGALFMNTARGAIVDEPALIDALTSGHLGGAYLDVFATEPLPRDSPLWGMENVLVTPHGADCIAGWDHNAAAFFVRNLALWDSGQPMRNVVHGRDV